MEITPEISEFVGAFIGDGHFTKARTGHYIGFTGDAVLDLVYYQRHMIPLVAKLVPLPSSHIYSVKNKQAIRIMFFTKTLPEIFQKLNILPEAKTYTAAIPEAVVLAGEACVFACIRGIFDTDGCVYWDRRVQYKSPYPRITLQTASLNLAIQLVTFLSPYFSLYVSESQKRRVFTIEIYGRDQLSKWMETIGFSNPRHLQKLQQAFIAQW